MEQKNPFASVLNNLLATAQTIAPSVLGKPQTVSAGVPNASGTPAAAPAKPSFDWKQAAVFVGTALAIIVAVFLIIRRS